ncbi:MAG TPA: adenylate/guanylate cyclase domain-containing protein [Acidimicrobiales bacterium]|nr:adenylate/guanylate cyclase domain-containing protein [Acidimicrobiales bacterium]
MREQRIEVQAPGRTPLSVVVVGTLEVGRDCDGVVVADARVSRRHARLSVTPAGLELVDLGTTNGTLVNGEAITGPVLVTAADRITLGDTRISVRDRSVSPEPAPAGDVRGTMAAPPAGGGGVAPALHPERTATIVFCDIVGSTALNERLGDRGWMAALAEHRTVVRRTLQEHGGVEIEAQGDGFVLAFASARRGIVFARDLQRALRDLADAAGDAAIRVRVGVHCGDTMTDAGDVFGQHVVIAARVCSAAGADEVLVTALARAVAGQIDEVGFGPARHLELKGVSEPTEVHPLLWG